MRKPTARIVVAALAIPVFGGFATYAAAQVSTQPSPQVVVPPVHAASTTKPASTLRVTSTSSTRPGHDANDDNGGLRQPGITDDPAHHDANDDHGNDARNTSSTGPGHDAHDDKGGLRNPTAATPASTPDTVDDHGHDAVTATTVPPTAHTTPGSTPDTVDDHGGDNGNRGKGGGGHDD